LHTAKKGGVLQLQSKTAMQLVMLLNNEVVDVIQVDQEKLQLSDYLIVLQAELRERNEFRLDGRTGAIRFALEYVPSKMAFQSILIENQ
jgi:hypothetical protein